MEEEMTMKKAWKLLNKRGIFTIEEFEQAKKEVYLDIGIFVMPLKDMGINTYSKEMKENNNNR